MGQKSMRWADGFIAVDWGTTNRRAYLIDGSGQCTNEFEDRKGVLSVAAGAFPDAVSEIRQRLGDKPLLLAGMVGSNRGWKEARYVPCPAGLDDLAAALVWAGEREAIVPGVSYS
jgi:2-dehydro-3-deoxygalactonokinase